MTKSTRFGALAFVPIMLMAWIATRGPELERWLLVGFAAGVLWRRGRSYSGGGTAG